MRNKPRFLTVGPFCERTGLDRAELLRRVALGEIEPDAIAKFGKRDQLLFAPERALEVVRMLHSVNGESQRAEVA